MADSSKARPATKSAANEPVAKKAPAKRAAAKKPAAKKARLRKPPVRNSMYRKPSKHKFRQEFLDEMRKRLLAERAKYLHSAEEYRAEADSLLESSEVGDVQFDEEGGEGTNVAVERERDIALSMQARETVRQIDAALKRLDDGTYGYCRSSGKPIQQVRLRAIPWADQRVEMKAGVIRRR